MASVATTSGVPIEERRQNSHERKASDEMLLRQVTHITGHPLGSIAHASVRALSYSQATVQCYSSTDQYYGGFHPRQSTLIEHCIPMPAHAPTMVASQGVQQLWPPPPCFMAAHHEPTSFCIAQRPQGQPVQVETPIVADPTRGSSLYYAQPPHATNQPLPLQLRPHPPPPPLAMHHMPQTAPLQASHHQLQPVPHHAHRPDEAHEVTKTLQEAARGLIKASSLLNRTAGGPASADESPFCDETCQPLRTLACASASAPPSLAHAPVVVEPGGNEYNASTDSVQAATGGRQPWQDSMHGAPNSKRHGWTIEEDEQIVRLVSLSGPRPGWAGIAACLPGRTDDAVRNR